MAVALTPPQNVKRVRRAVRVVATGDLRLVRPGQVAGDRSRVGFATRSPPAKRPDMAGGSTRPSADRTGTAVSVTHAIVATTVRDTACLTRFRPRRGRRSARSGPGVGPNGPPTPPVPTGPPAARKEGCLIEGHHGDDRSSVRRDPRSRPGWRRGQRRAALSRHRTARDGLRARPMAAHDPEDIAQEVFVAMVRRFGTFVGGERAFRSWLLTITAPAGGRRAAPSGSSTGGRRRRTGAAGPARLPIL